MNWLRNSRSLFITLFVVLGVTTGCAGTVIVDFDVQAEVSGRDAFGRTWRATQDRIVRTPPPAGLLSPFSSVKYRGELFEWTFGTGTLGFGGRITNHGDKQLCFLFDQATLASNLHPRPVPMRVYHFARTVDGRWQTLGSTVPAQRRYFVAPPLCLNPGQYSQFMVGPELAALFPHGTMFNVRWKDGDPDLPPSLVRV